MEHGTALPSIPPPLSVILASLLAVCRSICAGVAEQDSGRAAAVGVARAGLVAAGAAGAQGCVAHRPVLCLGRAWSRCGFSPTRQLAPSCLTCGTTFSGRAWREPAGRSGFTSTRQCCPSTSVSSIRAGRLTRPKCGLMSRGCWWWRHCWCAGAIGGGGERPCCWAWAISW